MKISFLPVSVAAGLLALAPLAHAQNMSGWTDDQPKALAQAKTEKKLVVMDFTGSDWCHWCIKLDKEVFSTPEFKQYAKDNLVLVEVDFPREKSIDPQTKKQNEALQEQYKVEGYPTVIVLDSEGKQVGSLGYEEGGAKAFIEKLKALKAS